jgi:hypothetical protein
MRKIILVSLFGFFCLNVFAQKKFRMGLTTSPMLSWSKPSTNNVEKGKMRAGFEYGLMVDYMFNDDANYGLFTGLLFSIEGSNLEPAPANIDNNIRLKYQYVKLPIALKLRTDRFAGDKIAVYGNFGGLNGFRIASKADVTVAGVDVAEDQNINKNFSFGTYTVKSRVYNFQLMAGAGIEFFVSENTSILAGFFYNHGFANVIKDSFSNKATLSNFGLRAGVMF